VEKHPNIIITTANLFLHRLLHGNNQTHLKKWEKQNQKWFYRKRKKKSTPASCDTAAATAIGVGLSTTLAVVVGGPASRAGHSVPLQRTVADVAAGGQNAPADLRSQLKLLSSQALSHGSLAG
ncbi:hypothetical protein F2P56_019311, partial [Juglans regia]